MIEKPDFMTKYAYIALIVNVIAAVFHLLASVGLSAIGTVSVILFIIAVGVDLGLIYLILDYINRNTEVGQKMKKICWIYLFFFLLAILVLMMDSLVYSFIEVGSFLRTISLIGAQVAYYGIYGLGVFTALQFLKYSESPEIAKS
jgi:hypothetical protein